MKAKSHRRNYRFHGHTIELAQRNAYALSTPGDMKTETDAMAIGQQVLHYLLQSAGGRETIKAALKKPREQE